MANRFLKFKGVKKIKGTSISKYNFKNNTNYYLFNPDNITSYKCIEGRQGEKLCYLFEFIQTMWGNDEINEYIILDDEIKNNLDISKFGKIENLTINNINIQYTQNKGLFSRYHYNAILNIKNITYYLYVKTIDDKRFFKIIEDFILNPINN